MKANIIRPGGVQTGVQFDLVSSTLWLEALTLSIRFELDKIKVPKAHLKVIMFDTTPLFSLPKVEQYQQLAQQARALMEGEKDRIANAANLSALVMHALPDLNWVGFYFYDGTELVLGPFQGKPACLRIQLERGRGAGRPQGRVRPSSCLTSVLFPAISPAMLLRARKSWCRWYTRAVWWVSITDCP